jgi:hypothetical protein
MKSVDIDKIARFVEDNIGRFHESRLRTLQSIDLRKVLTRKNPYLFRAKNVEVASELVTGVLDAYLSSSEEGIFGNFLESLAQFVVSETFRGDKSSTAAMDIDFRRDDVRYIVSVKSGKNWGNSTQHKRLEEDFRKALKVVKQLKGSRRVDAVLGICYGKPETTITDKGYTRIVGQHFWEFISAKETLYTDIIEPLGVKAKEHNQHFLSERARIINIFTRQFTEDFCDDGRINWKRLVEFNSGPLKMPRRKTSRRK